MQSIGLTAAHARVVEEDHSLMTSRGKIGLMTARTLFSGRDENLNKAKSLITESGAIHHLRHADPLQS
jgi:hypothetical protein